VATDAKQDTRGRILDAALELFSEHGFEGTTLQQIADRLGVTKAALYYHFPSKDDLLDALHAPLTADLETLLTEYEDRERTPAMRRAFIEEYIDYLLLHRRLIAYVVRDLAALSRPTFAKGAVERRRRIEALIAGGELDFAEQVRTGMVVGGAQAIIAHYRDRDAEELRAALIEVTGMLLNRTHPTPVRSHIASPGSRRDRQRQ
jgi:AcrR family transcriptional regulator